MWPGAVVASPSPFIGAACSRPPVTADTSGNRGPRATADLLAIQKRPGSWTDGWQISSSAPYTAAGLRTEDLTLSGRLYSQVTRAFTKTLSHCAATFRSFAEGPTRD